MSTYGLWLSAAGMKVNEYRQELLTHNMANANTVGFKQDLAVVRERAAESRAVPQPKSFSSPTFDGMVGGINVKPTFHSFAQGDPETTGRPLDVAIEGDGFFAVSDGKTTRYTRNGQFLTNSKGELLISSGDGRWKVLDDKGKPIGIDPEGAPPSVTSEGIVRQGEGEIATIGLYTTARRESLRKFGETLFDAGSAPMTRVRPILRTGAVERSNFDVMTGLASMIEASRAYEINANILRLQDESVSQAVNTVGRLA